MKGAQVAETAALVGEREVVAKYLEGGYWGTNVVELRRTLSNIYYWTERQVDT